MMLKRRSIVGFRRVYSSSSSSASYDHQIATARRACKESLHQFDKSSYVLSAYVPAPARDCFIAIRSFNVEVSKITGSQQNTVNTRLKSTIGVSSTDLRIKFWEELLYKVFENPFSDQVVGEPVALLLRDSLRNEFNLDLGCFERILSSRADFLQRSQFQTVDEMCSYGEGVFSQLNYLVQSLLLSDQLSPSTVALVESSGTVRDLATDIVAHLGQATSVATLVLGTNYYAAHQNRVLLPIDLMSEHGLSQEDLLRLFQGHEVGDQEQVLKSLKEVIFQTCITANDHLLTARSKLKELQAEIKSVVNSTEDEIIIKRSKSWKKDIPDCLYVPFMNAIPLAGYLRQLEKHDFDIVNNKIENAYWRLVWDSYRSYQTRSF